jgi:hypothetical protein
MQVRNLLVSNGQQITGIAGVADVIFLYFSTKIFFSQNAYDKVTSKNIEIRYCDISAGESPT